MAQVSKEEERLARILAAKGETKNEAHVQSLLATRRKQEEDFSLARYKAAPVEDASLSSEFEGTQLFRKYASGQPASKSDSGGKEKQIFSKYKLNEAAAESNQKQRVTDNKPAPPRAKEDAQKEVSAGTAAFRHYASAQPMRMADASGDEKQMLAKYMAPSIEEEQKLWQQKMRREEEQKKQEEEEMCRRQEAAEKEISGTVLFRHYASAQPMKKEQEASAGEELELFARYGRVEPVEEGGDLGGNEDAKNNKKEERRKSWDSGSGIKSRSASGSTPKEDEKKKEIAGAEYHKTEKEEELQQQQLKQHQRRASLEKGWTGAPRKDSASSPSTSSTAPAFKALVSPRRTNFERQFYDAFQGTVIADDKRKQEDVLAKYKISGNEKDGAVQGAERREEKPVVRSEGSFFRKFSGAATTEVEAKNAREEAAMNQALDKYRINK